ncbi:hypothetical protein CHARACLAT_023534 [Characodon lateralis]|uniref:CCDC92/74 N-terminal domain-containing protein n=1 Tax=Characodon lateralis TaxID=208331 RepID=A0ABU7F7I8_9TELE|nr:hypothetical protein [Characodon lateralis]
MDAGRLEQQVASVERGICFLKQDHLTMLTGLQLEITHLKRRCQELSYELDSKFPDRNTAGKTLDSVRKSKMSFINFYAFRFYVTQHFEMEETVCMVETCFCK